VNVVADFVTGYLHLAYHAAEVTLYRCVIRSLSPPRSIPSLHHFCRSAAKTQFVSAVDFVYRLRPEHLQSFWYFASKVNLAIIGSFGCLLWATAEGKEEAEFYKSRLNEYKWTLRVRSKGVEFMGFAMEIIDASMTLLTVQAKNSNSRPPENAEEAFNVHQSQDSSQRQYAGRNDQGLLLQNYQTIPQAYPDPSEEYDPSQLDLEGLLDQGQGLHQTSPSATLSADLSADEPDAQFYSPDGVVYGTEAASHEGWQDMQMAQGMWMGEGNGLVDAAWHG
jgi:hypothetical protein